MVVPAPEVMRGTLVPGFKASGNQGRRVVAAVANAAFYIGERILNYAFYAAKLAFLQKKSYICGFI